MNDLDHKLQKSILGLMHKMYSMLLSLDILRIDGW